MRYLVPILGFIAAVFAGTELRFSRTPNVQSIEEKPQVASVPETFLQTVAEPEAAITQEQPAQIAKSNDEALTHLFSHDPSGEKLKSFVLRHRGNLNHQDHALENDPDLQDLQKDAAAAMEEIRRVLDQMPNDRFADEKLLLIEASAKLPGNEDSAGALALDLALGRTHAIPKEGSPFETFALPMGSFEVFINTTSDESALLDGAVQVIGAQENEASRRMLRKLFIALRPEMADELSNLI